MAMDEIHPTETLSNNVRKVMRVGENLQTTFLAAFLKKH